jgi:methyl-accepting chemotaxis protein
MDQVTQQNAALVEQAAAAADSMQEQAHQLAALVGTFRTGRAVQAAPARAAVAPVPAKPRAALAAQPVRKETRREPVVATEEWETF